MILMRPIRCLRDLMSLSFDIINNNRKFMVPTTIGLIIALGVVSQIFLLIDSSRGDFFEELVEKDQSISGNEYYSDLTIYLSAIYPGVVGADRYTNFSHYNKLLDNALTDYEDIIAEYSWYSEPIVNINHPNREYITPISTSSSTTFFESLEPLIEGSLPKNSSEIVLIRPDTTITPELYDGFIHGLNIGSSILLEIPQVYFLYSGMFKSEIKNKTVTISGIINVSPISKYSTLDNKTQLLTKYLNHTYSQTKFLATPEHLNQILSDVYHDKVFTLQESMGRSFGQTHMIGKIFLETDNLDIYNPIEEKTNIQKMATSIENGFVDWGYIPQMRFDILANFDTYIASISNITFMLFLVGAPVIIVSFYLMIYSFDLIKRQKNNQLRIIKTRGTSWKQIMIALYSEIIVSSIISSILAFILSIYFTSIFLKSSGYILFTGSNIAVKINPQIFLQVFIIGFLSSVIINIIRVFKTSREDIEDTIIIETKEPVWKRFFLDVIVFIIGLILWLNLISSLNNDANLNLSNSGPLQILFIIGPFLIFLGCLGLIGRLFFIFIRVIRRITYVIDLGILTLGLQNLVRHKHVASRTALILTIAISISSISSFLIFSLDETEQLRIYSNTGADISFSYTDSIPVPAPNYFSGKRLKWTECVDLTKRNQIKQIPHVVEVSTIFTASANAFPGYGITELYTYHFLFINTTNFDKTVEIHPDCKLNGDINDLKMSNIFLLRNNFDALNLTKNDKFYLPFYSYFYDWAVDRQFWAQGTFDYWPNLVFDPSDDFTKEFWIIGDISLLERLHPNSYLINIEARGIVKIDNPEKNAQNVAESIFEITGYEPTGSYLEYEKHLGSFSRNFNLAVLNANVIITMVISLAACLMFSFYMILERGKEIGIERAIGLSRIGIAKLFFIESTIILFFGSFVGFLTGNFFTSLFFQITQLEKTNTPFIIVVPFEFIISDLAIKVNEIFNIVGPIYLGIFVLTAITMILPAYLASRTDIIKVLRVE